MTIIKASNIDTISPTSLTLSVKASSVNAISINSNGNIGIGNTTPGSKLTAQTIKTTSSVRFPDSTVQFVAASGYNNAQVFTANGTFTAPANTNRVRVTVIGGGGGGYGRNAAAAGGNPPTPAADPGFGGAGGGSALGIVDLLPGQAVTVTVGPGGANGGPAGYTPGGTSSFGSFISATGGTITGVGVSGTAVGGQGYGPPTTFGVNLAGTATSSYAGASLETGVGQSSQGGKPILPGFGAGGPINSGASVYDAALGFGCGGEGDAQTDNVGSPGSPGVVIVEFNT